jgi:hypothetical protein
MSPHLPLRSTTNPDAVEGDPNLCAAATKRPSRARGDPAHDQVVTGIVARLAGLARRAVVLAEDDAPEPGPHMRASWTLRGLRAGVLTPGTNRKSPY